MKIPVLLLSCLLLTSCAIEVAPPTQEQVSMQSHNDEVRSECYKAMQAAKIYNASMMSKVPEASRTMVVLLQQQGEFSKQMLAMATGRSIDPCSGGTNYYDVKVAELNAKKDMAKSYIDGTLGLAKWVVGGYTVAAILDKAGGDVYTATNGGTVDMYSRNQGSFNENVGDDISGSNSPVSSLDNSNNPDNRECTNCDGAAEKAGTPEPRMTLEECKANPPGGWDWIYPMHSPGCSCKSYSQGHCI